MVTQASLNDIQEIVKMAKILHDQHSWTGKFNQEWKTDHLKNILNNQNYLILIAKERNEIVGYSIGYLNKEDAINQFRCIILEIFVYEKYRRNCTGLKLAQKTIKWANRNNVFEIIANVAVNNVYGGIELFEKLGFVERSISFVTTIRPVNS